jgi:flagellar protein FlaG
MEITNNVNSFSQSDQNSNTSKAPKVDRIKAYQQEVERDAVVSKKLSKMEMEKLIANLNDEISLISTDLRFGYNDTAEMLQVSIINKKTDEIIRRFPTEEAVSLMSSMKEFIGLLFDKQG